MTDVHNDKCIPLLVTELKNLTSKINFLSAEIQRLHHRFDKVEEEIQKKAYQIFGNRETVHDPLKSWMRFADAQVAEMEEVNHASSSAAAVVMQPAEDDKVPTSNAVLIAGSNDADGSSSGGSSSADGVSNLSEDVHDPLQSWTHFADAQAAEMEEANNANSSAAAVVMQPAQDHKVPTRNAVLIAGSNDANGISSGGSSSAVLPPQNAVLLILADAPHSTGEPNCSSSSTIHIQDTIQCWT